MEHNHTSPLVVIEKVEYINHNHVDTAQIIHALNRIGNAVNEVLELVTANSENKDLGKQMDSWLVTLSKSVEGLKTVSEQVDSTK